MCALVFVCSLASQMPLHWPWAQQQINGICEWKRKYIYHRNSQNDSTKCVLYARTIAVCMLCRLFHSPKLFKFSHFSTIFLLLHHTHTMFKCSVLLFFRLEVSLIDQIYFNDVQFQTKTKPYLPWFETRPEPRNKNIFRGLKITFHKKWKLFFNGNYLVYPFKWNHKVEISQ